VHLGIVHDLDLDVDAGLLLELGYDVLDEAGVGHALHEDVDGLGMQRSGEQPDGGA
jgi:hypothetical protein